jgi:hypothetical protein
MAKRVFNIGEVVLVCGEFPRFSGKVMAVAQREERYGMQDRLDTFYLIRKSAFRSKWVNDNDVAEIMN